MPDVLFAPWRYEYLVSDKSGIECFLCEAAASEQDAETLIVLAGKAGDLRGWGAMLNEIAPMVDAEGAVEDAQGEPAVVVGHSHGGLFAEGLARSRPEAVRGLVLVDASDPVFEATRLQLGGAPGTWASSATTPSSSSSGAGTSFMLFPIGVQASASTVSFMLVKKSIATHPASVIAMRNA